MYANEYAFWKAFRTRSDLTKFGDNALLLFAIQMKFDEPDVELIADNCITEGFNDKKADLIYVNEEAGQAVIAQAYMSKEIKKTKAKANKASDLNTAIGWLLTRDIDSIPAILRSHAQELRQSIVADKIRELHIWYVHNLPESKDVQEELKTVRNTANSIIKTNFPQVKTMKVSVLEVGVKTLDEWYQAITTPILVPDIFEIEVSGGFQISEADWSAYVTVVPATWLHKLYKKYDVKLQSANVREYLGSRETDTNINYNMKKTATDDPSHFMVFNNGMTVLVHRFIPKRENGKTILQIEGFSVVNGSQTTGVIGTLRRPPNNEVMVQVRFIMCKNPKIVHKIVKYNNTQNGITASDFRSRDPIQRRLSKEFSEIPGVKYLPRRGSAEDIIKRTPNALQSVTAGQALAAFHGNPGTAYHEKTRMWESNDLYNTYFKEQTTASHITFTYALLKAVEQKKRSLWDKSKTKQLRDDEKPQLDFFQKRGSIFMMVSAIAECLGVILDRPITDLFELKFKENLSPEQGVSVWLPIIEIGSPFVKYLADGLSDGFKADEKVKDAILIFRDLVSSTKQPNNAVFAAFKVQVV
jgi:hypothetical protein